MKKIWFLSLVFAFCQLPAQETTKALFEEGDKLMEEYFYEEAIKIWDQLLEKDPDNANLNYKKGVCLLELPVGKSSALSYLQKAIKNTSPNYKIYDYTEKNAPVDAYFFLGKAQQLNYKFEEAIKSYSLFLAKVTEKHYLFAEATKNIDDCTYAHNLINNPVKLKITNLGNKINTKYPEYSPVISIDESAIFFTSRRLRKDSSNLYIKDPDDGMYFEDIYVSYNLDGRWTDPELLSFNTDGHEATINISADGQTLFIYKDENGNGELYSSTFDGENWSVPVKLGSNINSEHHETHVAISPDNERLYFVSNRPGGLGGKDIWYCNKLPNGEWALAQNAGPTINTAFDEDGVFIHPDGKTLYFSSKGHRGLGGYDIFYSELDPESGQWQKPVNLGYPINSTDDDVFYVVSADGKRAYFSSIKENGQGEKDIYVLELYDAKEKALTLLIGTLKVAGMNKLPDDALITLTNNENGELVGRYKPRAIDGRFSIIIPPGSDYHIVYSAAGYTAEEDIYVPEASSYQELNKAIELKPVIFGETKSNTSNTNKGNNTTTSKNNNQQGINTQTAQTATQLSTQNNITPNDIKTEKDIKETKTSAPTTQGNKKPYFEQFFDYNVKDISPNKEFEQFITEVVATIEKEGGVKIAIESSASKVPTQTFITNENLSEKRALEAKLLLFEALRNKNIKSNQVSVNNITTLVQGPEYTGDYKNIKKYRKYQYVKIRVE